MTGIREFYRSGNDPKAISRARDRIQSISNTARRANNERVLNQFERNESQFGRKLLPESNKRFAAKISAVELKLSTDLRAIEGKRERFLYYNCKNITLSARVAEDTLAIGHWVLQQNEVDVPIDALEFIDLCTGEVYRLDERRPAMAKTLVDSVRIIEDLWPSV